MLHFLPDSFAPETATPYTEAVARLASIRTALTVAEQAAGIEAGGIEAGGIEAGEAPESRVAAAWPEASEARRRCFDTRSIEAAQAAAAGLEMLAAQRAAGAEAHPRSVERLALTLRTELAGLDRLFSL